MRLLLVLAALPLSFGSAQLSAEPTVTVLSTMLITITSCHPTVTDCPGRNHPLPSSSIGSLHIALPSWSPSSVCQSSRCNADNCLRAFERGQGQKFCSTFTQSVVTETAGLPSYTTKCTGSTISRVSSACSCLNNACTEASSTTIATAVQAPAEGCNADNCLRAFERGEGQAFCSIFAQSIVTTTVGLPSYATQCTGSTIARISSACSCLESNTFASTPQLSSSTASSISTGVSQPALSTPVSVGTQPSQSAFSTPASINTHSSQSAFSTPASINTHTSQSAFSTPASTNTHTSQSVFSTLVASAGTQTASASMSTAASGESSSLSIASSAPAQVFSFTTVGTNSAGSPFTSVVQATITPSTASPSKPVQSIVSASAQPSSQPLQVFSFTTTGINAQGSTFSSVIVATLTPSQASPSLASSSVGTSQPEKSSGEVFSFTSTGVNAQGSPFSTVIVATVAPSSGVVPSAAPSIQPFSFTSTGTNAQGIPFTTVIQRTFTPSEAVLPFTSTEVETNAQGSKVTSLLTGFGFPFTSTVTGTDSRGVSFTSLFTGVAPTPGGSFTGVPSPTGPPNTSGLPLSGAPPPTGTVCSPFPTCLYPSATDIPATCSPFPSCLLGAIPTSVQSELSWNCGTTSLLPCILGEPDATCNQWPRCLTSAIGTDICDGFPFPDCLFTLYSPVVTSTITTEPPGLTLISTSIPNLTTNTITQTKNNDGILVWWPIFASFGCPECGAFDWILGNLPTDSLDLFNIDFTLPGLPEIPEFHFPVS